MIVEILYCTNLIAIALYGFIWYARAQKYLKGWNESLELQKPKIEQLNKLYEMNIKLLHEKRELEKEIRELKSQIRDTEEMVKKFNDCIVSLSEKNKEIIVLKYKVRELKLELNKVNNNEKTEI
ncbi:hypothetical protein [Streptobacillus canis]|uniref:hypothetical protein n=1 Tax=Streptobacillus canis TaxID=2678686 RepID=UPI0012E32D4D|nr:hypothetical protein [Streptobacillus canis]